MCALITQRRDVVDDLGVIADLLGTLSTSAVFLLLFWRERQRTSEISDARIEDWRRWVDVLTSIIFDRQKGDDT